MKKITLWAFALAMLCAIASCSENDLDLQPLDAISELDVYNDEALLNALVSAAYTGLPTVHFGNRMGTAGMTDLGFNWRGANGANTYNQAQMDDTNGESVTFGLWSRSYDRIRDINTFFDRIEGSSLSQDDLDPFIGEMRFLRAYYYFELFRHYGDVPLIVKRFEVGDDFSVTRDPVQEIVDFIVQELDAAAPLLSTDGPKARATRQAALALKGRTLLYAASELFTPGGDQVKWQAAADANKAAIDLAMAEGNTLSPDYASIFLDQPLESEILFTREFNDDNNQGGWSGANVLLWPNGSGGWGNVFPTNKFIDMFEMTNGELPYLSDGSVNPASGFDPQDPYVDRDPRFYDIVLYNGAEFKDRTLEYWIEYEDDGDGRPIIGGTARVISGGGLDSDQSSIGPWNAPRSAYNIRKLTDESKPRLIENRASATTPDIYFRTTELLLNYVEAQLELDNEDDARTTLNTIRARASVNMPPIPNSVTGVDLVEAYRKERAIELFMEEHRFHDLRRWKIAGDVLGANANYRGLNVERRSDGTFAYDYTRIPENTPLSAWNDRQYFFPIPFSEIEASGGSLTQNLGY